MGNKLPQPTMRLVKRLQRVAKALEAYALGDDIAGPDPIWSARANTCWQCAARLEELEETHGQEQA